MKGLYQGDISPLSPSITDFVDSLYTKASSSMSSLWQCGIGGTVNNFIQSTENGISNWFWQGISDLPRSYFAKDVTEVNYYNKNFWQGVFNDELQLIQERLLSEIAEDLSHTSVSQLSTSPKFVRVDKLKEQMAAGLAKSQASLKEQLIQLQGLVGKYTVSPQHYEQSLDNLQQVVSDNSQYKAIIEKVKESFRSALKVQPEFLAECLQGEVLHCFREGGGELLTLQFVRDILNYYKPLMQHKTYMQQQHWLQQCYKTQSFLPPPQIIQQHKDELLQVAATLPSSSTTQDHTTSQGTIRYLGKLMWEHLGKIVTLGLAAQVATGQAKALGKINKALSPTGRPLTNPSISTAPTERSFPEVFESMLDCPTDSFNLMLGWHFAPKEEELEDVTTPIIQTTQTPRNMVTTPTTQTSRSMVTTPITQTIQTPRSRTQTPKCAKNEPVPCDRNNGMIHNLVDIAKSLGDLFKLLPLPLPLPLPNKIGNTQEISNQIKNYTDSIYQQVTVLKRNVELCQFQLKETNNTLQGNITKLEQDNKSLNVSLLACESNVELCQFQLQETNNTLQGNITKLEQDNKSLNVSLLEREANVKLCQFQLQETNKTLQGNITKLIRDTEYLKRKNVDLLKANSDLARRHTQEINEITNGYNVIVYKLQGNITKLEQDNKSLNVSLLACKVKYDILYQKLEDDCVNIIRNVYGNNLSNFEKIIDFIQHFSAVEQRGIAYSVLFNEMRRNNHLDSYQLVMLAYQVKQAQEDSSNSRLDNLKSQLPNNIRRLLWDSWVQMESRQHLGYVLDLANDDNNSGLIYGRSNHHGNNQKWIVNVKENGRYFRFINQRNEKALAAFGGSKVRGVDFQDCVLQHWQVIPVNSDYIYFKNRNTGRILDVNYTSKCTGNVDCTKVYAREDIYGDTQYNHYQHWKIL